jgi:RecJ-like exonuclease
MQQDNETLNPGDKAPPDASDVGREICTACHGTGKVEGARCMLCGGTGKVLQGIGGG